MTKHFWQTFFSKISECFQTLHTWFLYCTLHSDEWLTLLQIHLVQKNSTEENLLCVCRIRGFFLILCFLFKFLENDPNLIYGNKWEISIERFWHLHGTERESAHGYSHTVNLDITAEGWRLSCCSSIIVWHWSFELLFRSEGWSERTANTLETPCQNLKSELGCCKGVFPFRGLEEETRTMRV